MCCVYACVKCNAMNYGNEASHAVCIVHIFSKGVMWYWCVYARVCEMQCDVVSRRAALHAAHTRLYAFTHDQSAQYISNIIGLGRRRAEL